MSKKIIIILSMLIACVAAQESIVKLQITPGKKHCAPGEKIKFKARGITTTGQTVRVKVLWKAKYGKIDEQGWYTAPKKRSKDAVLAIVRYKGKKLKKMGKIFIVQRKGLRRIYSLEEKITSIVEEIAREYPRIKKMAISKITYHNSGLSGPFAFKLKSLLKKAVSKQKNLKVFQVRAIRIVGFYSIEINYGRHQQELLLTFKLKNPRRKLVKEFSTTIASFNFSRHPALLPENHKKIAMAVKEFQQDQSAGFSLNVTTERGLNATYSHNESLVLEIAASKDCYLHIFYLQANGELVQIFPNEFHQDNKIKGGQLYKIPKNYPFDFQIDTSEIRGMEIIKAMASLKPLPITKGQDLGYGLKEIKENPRQFIQKYRSLGVIEASCTILTK